MLMFVSVLVGDVGRFSESWALWGKLAVHRLLVHCWFPRVFTSQMLVLPGFIIPNLHKDVITWQFFPHCRPFVKGIRCPKRKSVDGNTLGRWVKAETMFHTWVICSCYCIYPIHRGQRVPGQLDRPAEAIPSPINQASKYYLHNNSQFIYINLPLGQDGRHFTDDVVRWIFVNENYWPIWQQVSIDSGNGLAMGGGGGWVRWWVGVGGLVGDELTT